MTRISVPPIAALLVGFVGLAGCDTYRGVSRRASVVRVPHSDCVIRSLESIQGVSNIRHEAKADGKTLTLTGLKHGDTFHYYFYDFKGLVHYLYFREDHRAKVEFVQTHARLNKPPPQTEIDTIRPIMRQLERRLESECNLPDLSVTIKEWCNGVKCS